MGLVDNLKESGFTPQASQDGIWEPYKGTYLVSWKTCRKDKDEKYGAYVQGEWDIVETLNGTEKRPSKFADFKKRYYLEGEKGLDNLKDLCNDAFTFGVDFDWSSDDAFLASFENVIGKTGYLKAWAWTPKDATEPKQSFVFQQEKIAKKAVKKEGGLPF